MQAALGCMHLPPLMRVVDYGALQNINFPVVLDRET